MLVVRDSANVTEHDFEPIVNHPSLFKLVVRGCAMTLATWQHLPLNSLKKVGIDKLPDVEGADLAVGQILATMPKLKSLILGVALVNDEFIESLAQCKLPFATITKLFLGGSFVVVHNFLANCGL